MRLTLIVVVALCATACEESRPRFPDAAPFVAAPPPPSQPAPVLDPVPGATADGGKATFARVCAPCHGVEGRGDGALAASLPHAPTDLTTSNHLCRTTVGVPAVPSLADLEGALDRGAHPGRKEITALDGAARRSLTLFLAQLAPGFARAPLPLLAVPAETRDTPEDRARGRVLYLALGCWKCHGGDGAGAGAIKSSWNGRPLPPLPLHDREGWLCGSTPTRTYQTLALGMGAAPVAMPGYGEYVEVLARPVDGDPASWTRPLTGHVSDEDVARVQAFYLELVDRATMHAQPLAERRARGAAYLWSLVHYSRSL